ncbi:MAG: ADOP family duplicated permease [Bryobacteraceae bacterium]
MKQVHRAARALWRTPGFTLSALATLALGIGSAVLAFAVLYSVVLRPMSFHDPERLAFVWIHDVRRGIHEEGLSYPTYLDWKARSRAFENLAVRGRGYAAILAGPEPERVLLDVVSANFLPLLGVKPSFGRVFTPVEEERGDLVAVISHRLARRRFGSGAAAMGGSLEMFGRLWRVVGVMPAGFGIPPSRQDVWVPARKFPPLARFMNSREMDFFMGVGRLNSGVTVRQAETEINIIGQQLAQIYPISDPGFGGYGVSVVPLDRQVLGHRLPRTLWTLLGAVVLVLLVACVNVANLLLARGAARQAEFAIRAALGAGVRRLVGQQLTEGVILAALGGTAGCALAWVGLRVLPLLVPGDLPRFDELAIHPPVLLFAALVSLVACVLFGTVPAWLQARRDPQVGLRGASARMTDRRANRLQSVLVVAEFALALVLLAGAGLFLRSFLAVRSVEPGFQAQGVLLLQVGREGTEVPGQAAAFYRGLLDRIRNLPGVETAGAINDFFIERNADYAVTVQGRPTQRGEQVTVDAVTSAFLQAVGARLLRGRFLIEADYQHERPAALVINETFARRFFPGEDAVGKHLKFGTAEARGPWIEVVGVVADLRRRGLELHALCEGFGPAFNEDMDVTVRSSVAPERLVPAIREAVRGTAPGASVYGIATLEARLAELAADRRLQVWSLSGFALLTLLLAAVGIGGVVQYVVGQRRRETAIRMALGATAGRVHAAVLGRAVSHALLGIGLGLALTGALTRVVSSLLFGVNPLDPATLVLAAVVLVFVAIAACWLPANAASRADPAVLMRE